MQPTRRDLHFHLPAERINDWHVSGRHVSHYFNSLSLFFPVGERFFIDSVRHYRERITDPELKRAVTAFIGQEAMHGREHEDYNALMQSAGAPAEQLERIVIRLLGAIQRYLPPFMCLSATIALEHFTAILADVLLREPRLLKGSEPHFENLWYWHALEETEHKAVAYDVWCTVMRPGPASYVSRVVGLLIATALLMSLNFYFYLRVVARDPRARWNLRGWLQLLNFQFISPGGLRRILPSWLSYFRPGFHPWQHDNRKYLERLAGLVERVSSEELQAA